MAVFSKFALLRNTYQPIKSQIRYGGHGNVLNIVPSPWPLKSVIDNFYYYWCFAGVPLFLITCYVNTVIGPAELRDIPEGYTPHNWEYERHPISRWLMKHLSPDPAYLYEIKMAYANLDMERMFVDKHERIITEMMARTADSPGKNYGSFDATSYRMVRRQADEATVYDSSAGPNEYNAPPIRFDTPVYPPYNYTPGDRLNKRWRIMERIFNPYFEMESVHARQNEKYADMNFAIPKESDSQP